MKTPKNLEGYLKTKIEENIELGCLRDKYDAQAVGHQEAEEITKECLTCRETLGALDGQDTVTLVRIRGLGGWHVSLRQQKKEE